MTPAKRSQGHPAPRHLLAHDGLDPIAIAAILGPPLAAHWITPPPEAPIHAATIDTRTAKPGNLFFALRGEHTDGHAFLDLAARAGCPAAVVDRPESIDNPPDHLAILAVKDSRAALATLAAAYRKALPRLRVIAVTGSNGKTTTVRLIHAALAPALKGSHAPGSFNNDLGLPLTLLNTQPDDDYTVCELGTNAPGEIAQLAEIAKPDLAVITSIGRSHLQTLRSTRGVAAEKAALVHALPPHALAVVPADTPELDEALEGARCEIRRIGIGRGVENIHPPPAGVRATIRNRTVHVPIPGQHNAVNAAMALEIAHHLGVDLDDAIDALAEAEQPPMRLERSTIHSPAGPIHAVNDAYNANPDSMLAAIEALARGHLDPHHTPATPRRVAVLGDMLELGDTAQTAHDDIAEALTDNHADIDALILVGPHTAALAERIEQARPGFVRLAEPDPDAPWTTRAARLIRPGDLVLLKASRGIRLERLLDTLKQPARNTPTG